MSNLKAQTDTCVGLRNNYESHLAQAVECGRIAWAAYAQRNTNKCRDYARGYREHEAECLSSLQHDRLSAGVFRLMFNADLFLAHGEMP